MVIFAILWFIRPNKQKDLVPVALPVLFGTYQIRFEGEMEKILHVSLKCYILINVKINSKIKKFPHLPTQFFPAWYWNHTLFVYKTF